MLTNGQCCILTILIILIYSIIIYKFNSIINKNIEKNKTIKLICNYIQNFILGLIIIAIIIFIATGAIGLW